ncbi:hypothetical protein M9Y10_028114 [Tritrichomonas musculus]|uniref:Uncharacterized protein n=1 Tax=Tritrichomonas musculus TaxID=1915356 RepID=A0ABR2KIL1_9EUKA
MQKSSTEELIDDSKKWANDVKLDMIAATLLDPNLICFRSVATDQPEEVVITDLMDQMSQQYVPHQVKDLISFLPTLIGNTVK